LPDVCALQMPSTVPAGFLHKGKRCQLCGAIEKIVLSSVGS